MTPLLTLLIETICITALVVLLFTLLAIFKFLLYEILGIKP